ncbi:MAG: (Fe-S)-binding protein [Candidatus Baldrarchaeia archaeon]
MHGRIGFFIGCTVARIARELYDSVNEVFDSLNIKFEVFGEDICCGMPLILSGYEEEVKTIAKEVINGFAKKEISLIVTSCPACYRMFSEYYPKILNKNLPFKFYHFTQFAYKIAKERELNLKIAPTMRVTYHDPCELGRYRQIYEEPRALLNMIQSLNLVELKLNRENSTCCGGGGLLKATFPQVAVEIAKEKIENEIIPLSVDAIITACPTCYLNFKDGIEETEAGIKVYNIEQILALALGGDDNE